MTEVVCAMLIPTPVVRAVMADDAISIPVPVVSPVRVMAIPTPVAIDPADTHRTLPVSVEDAVTLSMSVASAAADENSERMPAPEADDIPVCDTLNMRAVDCIAVEEFRICI